MGRLLASYRHMHTHRVPVKSEYEMRARDIMLSKTADCKFGCLLGGGPPQWAGQRGHVAFRMQQVKKLFCPLR